MPKSEPRTKEEIKIAHDVLHYVMRHGEFEDNESKLAIVVSARVLCWILNHPGSANDDFDKVINRLRLTLLEGGIEVGEFPKFE